jgi:lipoprotein signal peptidase
MQRGQIMNKSKLSLYLAIFILLISVDQFSKYSVRHLGGFYICNLHLSWGVSMPEYIFWLFWFLIMLFLLIFSYRKRKKVLVFLPIALILSGAVSNMIDRIFLGCVVDFINLKIWPVFNLADIFIISGAVILLARWRKL